MGAIDILSTACHPSQTVHQQMSSIRVEQCKTQKMVLHRRLHVIWRPHFKRLPFTLYNKSHITTTGYSKVSRGLHFPLEFSGLCTGMECSEDSNSGQCGSRYAIDASRQSNDKVLRYLKRVIVTPAVYLLLASLEESLKYRHWASVTDYTHLCRLAVS